MNQRCFFYLSFNANRFTTIYLLQIPMLRIDKKRWKIVDSLDQYIVPESSNDDLRHKCIFGNGSNVHLEVEHACHKLHIPSRLIASTKNCLDNIKSSSDTKHQYAFKWKYIENISLWKTYFVLRTSLSCILWRCQWRKSMYISREVFGTSWHNRL